MEIEKDVKLNSLPKTLPRQPIAFENLTQLSLKQVNGKFRLINNKGSKQKT